MNPSPGATIDSQVAELRAAIESVGKNVDRLANDVSQNNEKIERLQGVVVRLSIVVILLIVVVLTMIIAKWRWLIP